MMLALEIAFWAINGTMVLAIALSIYFGSR